MAPQAAKRRLTDDLEGEQRLAKKFDGLNIDRDRKLPASTSSSTDARTRRRPRFEDDEWMDVDATKHKVYIHDLDKELEEAESDEERPIFVPDIEKHLMKIPKRVLVEDDIKALANMQLVLYGAPASLTVPQDKDSVRRAIIEARQRARDNQALRIPDASTAFLRPQVNGYYSRLPNGYIDGLQNGALDSRQNSLHNRYDHEDISKQTIGGNLDAMDVD